MGFQVSLQYLLCAWMLIESGILMGSMAFSVRRLENDSPYPVYDDYSQELQTDDIRQTMLQAEHTELKRALTLALKMLNAEDDILNEESINEFDEESLVDTEFNDNVMSFYLNHLKSRESATARKPRANSGRRRNHRKRSTFDSIGHQGGMSGLSGGQDTHNRKLEFTFENLLPYLIRDLRRNSRETRD